MKIQDLLKAKKFTEKKIELNTNLLDTIQALKEDETTLKEEIEVNKLILKLINKKLREEYR